MEIRLNYSINSKTNFNYKNVYKQVRRRRVVFIVRVLCKHCEEPYADNGGGLSWIVMSVVMTTDAVL